MIWKAVIIFISTLQSVTIGSTVQWDASSEAARYILYGSTNGLGSILDATVRIDVGTNQIASINMLPPGNWTIGVTAVSIDGLESELSNLVMIQIDEVLRIRSSPKTRGAAFIGF